MIKWMIRSEHKRHRTVYLELLLKQSTEAIKFPCFQANVCGFFLSDSLFRAVLIELSVMMEMYFICVQY